MFMIIHSKKGKEKVLWWIEEGSLQIFAWLTVSGSTRIVSSHIDIHTAAAYQSGSGVSIALDEQEIGREYPVPRW